MIIGLAVVSAIAVLVVVNGNHGRLGLTLSEVDGSSSSGAIVAIVPGHVFRWDGRLLRWSPSIDSEPIQSFDLQTVDSVKDIQRNEIKRVSGLGLGDVLRFSASPDGSRVAFFGGIQGSGLRLYSLAVDLKHRTAWGFSNPYIRSPNMDGPLMWVSSTRLVFRQHTTDETKNYSVYDLDTLRMSNVEGEKDAFLRLAGAINGEVAALRFFPDPARWDESVLITEYRGTQPRRSVVVPWSLRRIKVVSAHISTLRDLWYVVLGSNDSPDYGPGPVFAIDPTNGDLRQIGDIGMALGPTTWESLAVVDGHEYLLVVTCRSLESHVFEISSPDDP